jgi:hypothetical protein
MTDQAVTTVASPAPYYITKSNVCVNSKGESVGNGLFAGRRFGAGEEIASFNRPLVGSLESERLLDTCANCYVWAEGSSTGTRLYVPEGTEVQKCAACQRFRYCSKASGILPTIVSIALIRYRHVKKMHGTADTSMSAKH